MRSYVLSWIYVYHLAFHLLEVALDLCLQVPHIAVHAYFVPTPTVCRFHDHTIERIMH
jgi:hypothetical protein